ncbi:polysaccharide deacetylase family protein [bacterium]|nr:polysaccharide deacetylase family protein [bacterium]
MNKLIKHWNPIYLQMQEIFLGCHPSFIYENSARELSNSIPVFIFHTVKPKEFEEKLVFLKKNNYIIITAEDIYQVITGKKKIRPNTVLLTFDDGRKSLWCIAFPLLKKYGFKATAFIIPGIIKDELTVGPNIYDINKENINYSDIENCDKSLSQIISWKEAEIMHESGVIDIQCHTNYHSRIPVNPKIETFINPDLIDRYFFKFGIPLLQKVKPDIDQYKLLLGAPVYQSYPGQLGHRMYIEDINLRNFCVEYVKNNGREDFFKNRSWKNELKFVVKNYKKEHNVNYQYESNADLRRRILNDLLSAKEQIERKIPGKVIRHISFPWGIGSKIAIEVLKKAGYVSAFWRIIPHRSSNELGDDPFRMVRLKHDYIYRLPGRGRKSLPEIFGFKLFRRITGKIYY